MTTIETQAPPPRGLEALRQAHETLLGSLPEGTLSAADIERIRAFLRQAAAAGALIDTAPERKQAQGLLDYWAATIYSQARHAPDDAAPGRLPREETVLAEFQTRALSDVAGAADRWFASVPEAERSLVRRILLRLVRLDCDGRTFRPEAETRRALHKLAAPQRVDPIVDGLRDVGVVRVEPAESPGDERVGLRYDAVMRSWGQYAAWLDQRLRFRDTVHFWQASGRDDAVLIRDEPLDEALDYHDRSDLEDEFVAASRGRERSQNTTDRRAKYILAALAGSALLFAAFAATQWSRANVQSGRAREQSLLAERKATLASAREAEAKEAQEQAMTATEALRAKSNMTNIIALTRTLAEIGTAGSEGEWQLAVRRLTILSDGLKNDPYFAPFVRELRPALAQIEQGNVTPQARVGLARQALEVGRRFKDEALGVELPQLISELESRRAVAYGMARYCGEQIVATLATRSFSDADPFVKEFWILYWSEMGMLEDPDVEAAMVAFGGRCKAIDRSVADELPSLGEVRAPKDTRDPAWYSTQQVRQTLSTLRSSTQLSEKAAATVRELSGRKVPARDVKALRDILQTQLIPALEAGVKAPFSRRRSLPATY